MFLVAYASLLLGAVRGLQAVGPLGIARGVVVIGVVAAFAQLIQKASGSGVIYGLWMPRQLNMPSAPFVNRNHTAGWLILVLCLTMGHLAAALARGLRDVRPGWRNRIGWLSSGEASEVVLTAFVIVVMAIAIVSTESRSGALSLILAITIIGAWFLQRQSSRSRKLLTLGHMAIVVGAAAVMGGADAVGRRFSPAGWENERRLDIWLDTLRIVTDFETTGNYQTVADGYYYIEAHNDYLQVAAEGGLLLGIPVLLLVAAVVREVWCRFSEQVDDTRNYWLRAGAVAGCAAIAFQSIFDFTLQMPGAATLFVIMLAITIHRPAPRFSRLALRGH
jgi:O-antigen ligase